MILAVPTIAFGVVLMYCLLIAAGENGVTKRGNRALAIYTVIFPAWLVTTALVSYAKKDWMMGGIQTAGAVLILPIQAGTLTRRQRTMMRIRDRENECK